MKTDQLLIVISLILISVSETAKSNYRSKRSNTENFNILLSIYKMNPLKHSNVFKAFSNRVLLPGPDDQRPALNHNLNESREKENRTNTKLKNEEIINYATHKSVIDRPLHIEEGKREKFDPGYFISKLVSINHIDLDNDDADIFNDDVVKLNSLQSETLTNYVTKSKNNVNISARLLEDSKVLNIGKVPLDVAETIVVK